jgi:hypothetical protein
VRERVHCDLRIVIANDVLHEVLLREGTSDVISPPYPHLRTAESLCHFHEVLMNLILYHSG